MFTLESFGIDPAALGQSSTWEAGSWHHPPLEAGSMSDLMDRDTENRVCSTVEVAAIAAYEVGYDQGMKDEQQRYDEAVMNDVNELANELVGAVENGGDVAQIIKIVSAHMKNTFLDVSVPTDLLDKAVSALAQNKAA